MAVRKYVMRVFHELSDEEIATLYHQRALAVLAELRDYDCLAVLGPCQFPASVEVLRVGRINTSTESYEVYTARGLQGYYQSADHAVRKLMEREGG